MMELKAKCLKKAVLPSALIEHPSPANLQSTRLALHIPMENSLLNLGKEDLLIPEQCEVLEASVVNRRPHRSEIQSIMLAETESSGCSILGSVDSYGHLIVSRLDVSGKDVNRLTYSVSPQDCGVGKGSWAGLCFNPIQWSMLLPIHFTFGGEPLYCARGCKIEAIGVEGRRYPCHLTNLRSISCCVFALVLQYSLCPLPEIFPDRLICLFQPSALREVLFVYGLLEKFEMKGLAGIRISSSLNGTLAY